MNASDRLDEAAKQTTIAHDVLNDADPDDLPDGVVDEVGELSERLRRVKNALPEAEA